MLCFHARDRMKNTHGGEGKLTLIFPGTTFANPILLTQLWWLLLTSKAAHAKEIQRKRKQGRMMLWENWAQGRWWILKTWFLKNDQNFSNFYWPKKKKLTKVHLPCLSGPSSQGKTAKIHEMCTNNIMKLTTWALCDLNISQEHRSDELLGIHFTDHYHPTDSLWTAPPRRKKFPEWQFSLSFCRKKTPPVGMVHRMVCDA